MSQFWKRSQEGVLLIDNSASGGKKVEVAITTCKHCQRGVVRNPDRVRPRAYCPKCDHYICDGCEAIRVATGYECVPMDKVFDELQNAAVKNG